MIDSKSNIDVSILSILPYPLAILDNNNYFVNCSNNWATLFQKEKDLFIGNSIFDVIPLFSAKFRKILEQENSDNNSFSGTEKVNFPNGDPKWLKWKVKQSANTNHKLISIEDVSSQKNKEILINKAARVARIGYWEVDLEDNSVFWSDITREIHETDPNYQPTLEEGINFYKPGKYRTLITQLVNETMQTGKPWDTDLIIVTAKGNEVWVHTKGEAERVNDKPVRIFGTFQDIDKTKRAQLKLDEASLRLSIATKEAKIGIWEFNIVKNQLLWDDNMFEIYGVHRRDFSGAVDAWEKTIHPEDKERGQKEFAMAISGEKEFDTSFRIVKSNGKINHIKAFAVVKRDEHGNPQKMLGANWDITDLKITQLQLQRSEDSFVGAFENSSIGMGLIGIDGKWMQANDSICNSLGYSRDELMQLTFQDITFPEDLEKDIDLLHEIINGKKESYQINKRYLHKNGKIVHSLLTVTAVYGLEGHLSHFIAQIVDLTKKKKNEHTLKDYLQVTRDQNNSLLNFAHIVSHNLRSHSTNMSMLIDFLLKENDLEETNKIKKMLQSASKGLTDTVLHLNEVVQVRTSTLDKMKSVNLLETIEGCLRNLAVQIEKNKPVLNINVSKKHYVHVVPAYLDSILLNLFTNAMKYCSPKRELELHISAEEIDNQIVVKFGDNGLGLDLGRYGTRVFGMFKTFHNHKDAKGIGLFITKNQIEAMRGTIAIESSVDVGTTFIMKFEKPVL